MKLLIILVTLTVLAVLPEVAEAPLLTTEGPFHFGRYWPVVRIEVTNAGVEAFLVSRWREVRR